MCIYVVYIYIYIYVRVYIHVYMCIYIYISTHTYFIYTAGPKGTITCIWSHRAVRIKVEGHGAPYDWPNS